MKFQRWKWFLNLKSILGEWIQSEKVKIRKTSHGEGTSVFNFLEFALWKLQLFKNCIPKIKPVCLILSQTVYFSHSTQYISGSEGCFTWKKQIFKNIFCVFFDIISSISLSYIDKKEKNFWCLTSRQIYRNFKYLYWYVCPCSVSHKFLLSSQCYCFWHRNFLPSIDLILQERE